MCLSNDECCGDVKDETVHGKKYIMSLAGMKSIVSEMMQFFHFSFVPCDCDQ